MIDIVKAKKYFKEYVSKYDSSHPRIRLKIVHMEHVAETSKIIAESMNLPEEEVKIAELIGLLHDIGRLEQWVLYNTFSDKLSVDHGQKSVEVLFADNEIRNFIEDNRYDSVIFKAILNHNKFEIEKGLSEKELLFTEIIRDADNIDIFRSFIYDGGRPEDFGHYGSKNISVEKISPEYFEKFKKEKSLLYSEAQNDMDLMVAIIAHVFVISFNESLNIIKNEEYIKKFIQKLNAQDEYTKEKLDEILKITENYIDRKVCNK
jgi:HD superfamily phosphohydrolase YqeK